MPITVLVVDDSGFFRRRLCEILEADPNIKVVGVATNGKEGVEKALELKPGVITMDYEMPLMNGIAAVREIMAKQPTPILMFSSLTHEGARITLDAIEAGAVDYLPKSFEDIANESGKMQQILREKVIAVARSRFLRKEPALRSELPSATTVNKSSVAPVVERRSARLKKEYELVAIGTSTGGPMALQQVLTRLPKNFPKPIVLIQHMPAAFTKAFAERLNRLCQIDVKEAEEGDVLKPGMAYLAPGGKQMMIDKRSGTGILHILPGDERLNYKPCVDITFGSAAKCYPGKVLAVVLTGMGADGREGARLLKADKSTIWAQNEESCVIYGMPMAIVTAKLADEVLALNEIGDRLTQDV
jgi:two-component system chemotaxis response regulator CheB